ncbi:hypothetical protein OESDEN_04192 [Oesophagostomum dentatum]|uniref:Receptor ligand binding region domain-containing protein n=1 Tax=Oesophagostomum dentatum TaxID=61180 RepID=A0A0B1TIC0_OESDE|nr:hypothetical protein OESDEN_04192 [Oesophagostomum dentatum]
MEVFFVILLYASGTFCVDNEIVEAVTASEYDDTKLTIYAGNANDTSALYDSKGSSVLGRIRVKIGHIGAQNALRNDVAILELSHKSLRREGILDEDFDVEIISQNGCGESFEGVAVAADMYHLKKVKAFIGPYCNAEMDAVASMAGFWNIPIIGYMAASNSLSNKKAYPTLSRISVLSLDYL